MLPCKLAGVSRTFDVMHRTKYATHNSPSRERWSFQIARAKLGAQVATGFVRLSSFLVEPGTAVLGSIASPAQKGGYARPESAPFSAAAFSRGGCVHGHSLSRQDHKAAPVR